MAFAAVLLLLATQLSAPSPRNSAADAVVQRSRLLGIDFRQGKERESAPEPDADASRALSGAGVGTWVDAQIEGVADEIPDPPAALREYLERNRESLWTLVSAVEKDEPDWGPDEPFDGELRTPFLPVLRLVRVLVALALVEGREGRPIEAGRALEAAWTLGRSVSSPSNLMTLLISGNAERMQVGALRKMSAPPLQWLGRLSSGGPWTRLPQTLRDEVKLRPRRDPAQAMFAEVAGKIYGSLADRLERLSPCDPSLASDAAIWTPAVEALSAETNAMKRSVRDFYKENSGELVGNVVRRAARLEVDREMTLKILQLRLDRAASRDGSWPEKSDTTSAACPEASYAYEARSGSMILRFEGTVESPKGSLPLAFRASNPDPPAVSKESP